MWEEGGWKGEGFSGEGLPLLEGRLDLVQGGRGMLVEVRSGPEIVPEFARVVRASGVPTGEITVISFNADTLRAVRRELPNHRTLHVVRFKPIGERKDSTPPPPSPESLVGGAVAAGLTGLDFPSTCLLIQFERCGQA